MVIKYLVKNKHRGALEEIVEKLNSLTGYTCVISDTQREGVVIDITFPREDPESSLLIGVLVGTIQSKHLTMGTLNPLG